METPENEKVPEPEVNEVNPENTNVSDGVEISVLKGNKILNKNNPFLITVNSPDTGEERCNVDLICVAKVSKEMEGEKLKSVKDSLKKILHLVRENDRLGLVLFNGGAKIVIPLLTINNENRKMFLNKIDPIIPFGKSCMLSGIDTAIDLMKEDKEREKERKKEELEKEKEREKEKQNAKSKKGKKDKDKDKDKEVKKVDDRKRVTTILLLSDGKDDSLKVNEIPKALKELMAKIDTPFTLHSFAYGADHDPRLLTKFCNLLQGSFFYVQSTDQIKEYLGHILGGGQSVLSELATLEVTLINRKAKIEKVFDSDNLIYQEIKDNSTCFTTKIIHLMSGKEYKFVLEINLKGVYAIERDLLNVKISYKNMKGIDVSEEIKFYHHVGINRDPKVDEEYLLNKVLEVLDEAMSLRENSNQSKAKSLLSDTRKTLNEHYKVNDDIKKILDDALDSMTFNEREYETDKSLPSSIKSGQFIKATEAAKFTNSCQKHIIESLS